MFMFHPPIIFFRVSQHNKLYKRNPVWRCRGVWCVRSSEINYHFHMEQTDNSAAGKQDSLVHSQLQEKKDESIPLDFKAWKEKGKVFFHNLKKRKEKDGSLLSKDTRQATAWIKNNAKWLIPLVCILIAISVSTYFRMMPSSLPITDNWAKDSVLNFYERQITGDVERQYPNLPQRNKDVLISQELQKYIEQNKELIDQQIKQTSQQFKNQLKDENGDTYLLEIDTYLWFSEARNYLRHGHLGDKINEKGESTYSLRDGRLDKVVNKNLNPYIGAYLFKIVHFFNNKITLQRAFFFIPVILIAFAMIPIFFLGRRIAGNVGGFFAALFLAINGPLLGRTPGGFSDTDVYNVLMPLLIAWFYIEAYFAKNLKQKLLFASLGGLSVGIYAVAWSGWSHAFIIIIGAVFLTIFTAFAVTIHQHKYNLKSAILEFIKSAYLKQQLTIFSTFLISSAIFVSWFQSYSIFSRVIARPLRFIEIKTVGVKTIWPNVLTTVAEFNTTSFRSIIEQMGGEFLAFLAVIGILFTLMKQENKGVKERHFLQFFLLTIWLIATAYAFTKGVRFSVLAAAPFSLALGIALGIIYQKGSVWISQHIHLPRTVSSIVILAAFFLIILSPLSIAQKISESQIPHFNDAWYGALIKIKEDTADSIITSWWDFGHWFQSIAERRVTFDGGDQGDRIHWVGRALLTDNEKEAIGILRMLNCRQELAPHKLQEFLEDELLSIRTVKEALLLDRTAALKLYLGKGLTAAQAQEIIEYTHCEDLLPNYFITSEDMVSKSGVWGHFGAWDFARAQMYQKTHGLAGSEAIAYLTENFGLSEQEASQLHTEIKTANPDRWIAPWPGYLAHFQFCQNIGASSIGCVLSLQENQFTFTVDLQTLDVNIKGNENIKPSSLVYVSPEGVIQRTFEGKTTGFSMLVVPQGEGHKVMLADPLQVAGMFTRLFFTDGHDLKCFQKFDERRDFTGLRIVTWKVDYDCNQENKVYVSAPANSTTV